MGDRIRKKPARKEKADKAAPVSSLADSLDPDQVLYRGAHRTIAFAKNENGNMHARDYLNEEKGDWSLRNMKAEIIDHCLTLADLGRCNNPKDFKHERGPIYGFTTSGRARVAAFQEGNVVFLTHGFEKDREWNNTDFEKANKIRGQQLSLIGRRS